MFTNSKLAKSIRLAIAVGVTSTALITSNTVFAQETSSIEEVESKEVQERIQITGSRIRTDSFGSDNPIDIITINQAENEGIKTLGELLRTSTSTSGSSQLIAALGVGFVTDGGVGTETVSLRGLGANRTLVLLNGRRAGPAGTRGAVSGFDLNTIPLSSVERIEILKDGASSLYGSDAVAGVVNIITRKGDSKTINVDISQPFESGGEEKRINFSYGEEFVNSSFRVTGDYRKSTELKRGDRDYLDCAERFYTNLDGTSADPIDPRTGQAHCTGRAFGLWLYPNATSNVLSGTRGAFDYDGFFAANGYESFNDSATTDANFRTPEGFYPTSFDQESTGWWQQDHPFQDNQTMQPEVETYSLYATGEYQVTSNIMGSAELIHSSRNTQTQSYRQFWNADIGFVQPTDTFDGFSGTDTSMAIVNLTDHSGNDITVDYTRLALGLTGSIGFWDWDLSYQNSYNDGEYLNQIIYYDSWVLAQQSAQSGISCAGQVTEFSGKTCLDLPLTDPDFIYGNQSDAAKEFLFGVDVGRTIYKQQTFEGYVTGELFELPAGEVSTAFGFSIQKDYIDDTPGEASLGDNLWGSTGAQITTGEQTSKAIYAELRVPLLQDVPFAESLALTTSGRWTDVDTYGSDTTFKLGLNWEIMDGLNVRANRGTSFRSPALFELFLGSQSGFFNQFGTDPCLDWGTNIANGDITQNLADNCAAAGVPSDYELAGSSGTIFTSGGVDNDLIAETSVNENIGVVWTSPENTYAFSVDYYDVVITDEVTSLSGAQISSACYTSQEFASEPLCNLIVRRDGTDDDYGIDEIRAGYVNVASQIARGIDYNFTYQEEFDFGSIAVELEHTMQIERTFRLFQDSEENNLVGEVGSPKHSGNLRLQYSKGDYSFNWTTRYVDSTNNYEYNDDSNEITYYGNTVTFRDETKWTTYHTASANVDFDNGLDLTVGIGNIFDKEPPKISGREARDVGNAALYSQYDFIGRRMFLNARYTF
jgi:outer membrane receptor protein involved in Fe transport